MTLQPKIYDNKNPENESYCATRLRELGITDELNHIEGITDHDDHPCPNWLMFSSDNKDNILIHYTTPAGEKIMYDNGNKNNPWRDYCRTRLKRPTSDAKYIQPKGTETYPFSSPKIIDTYKKAKKVKTLYVVEGEFKAVKLSLLGLPAFGIPGISSFKEKGKANLHKYFLDYIDRCKVDNIVIIYDADYKKIKWEDGKDIAKRLHSFYNSLLTFSELLKSKYPNITLYFSPVKHTCPDKGIDDLLCNPKNDKQAVKKELEALMCDTENRQFVETYLITGKSPTYIQSIFYLDNKGLQRLYDENAEQLRDKEFVFNGESYFADENGKVQRNYHGALKQYIRVGSYYYKRANDMHNGIVDTYLIEIKKSTISDDFGKNFLNAIQKYDDFGNLPDNNRETYQQDYFSEYDGLRTRHYNLYSPIAHEPVEGEWQTIDKLLHHIFDYSNTQGETMYEFGLDYLQLIFKQPKHHLPILCLVSKARGTGKTTFLNFLKNIFTSNMVITDSDRISSQFSGSWAGKLIVAVDESKIAVEKYLVAERLKMLATNDTIVMEQKGREAQQIKNYSKLIMCSNEVNNFVKIDPEENRYAVIEVKTIENYDVDFQEKIIAEIPAFLHYLCHRKLHYENKSRLYFDPSVYNTEALEHIKERTQSGLVRLVKDVVSEQFYKQKKQTLLLSRNQIFRLVSDTNNKYKISPKDISDCMHDMGYKTVATTSCTIMISESQITEKAKPYKITAEEWMSQSEYNEFCNDIETAKDCEIQSEETEDEDKDDDNDELPF